MERPEAARAKAATEAAKMATETAAETAAETSAAMAVGVGETPRNPLKTCTERKKLEKIKSNC